MEKRDLDRRLAQMEAEGTEFRAERQRRRRRRRRGAAAPSTTPSSSPAARPRARDLPIPGRELEGIHLAMEFLPPANRVQEGDIDRRTPIIAEGKHVVIIGGGDTGADCLGTAHRQGAASVHQFEIMPRPPDDRAPTTTRGRTWPLVSGSRRRTRRAASACTQREHRALPRRRRRQRARAACPRGRDGRRPMLREGRGHRLRAARPTSCLLAMGFVGPEQGGMLDAARRRRSTSAATSTRDDDCMTNVARRVRPPATWAAARASSCGPSPRAALRPRRRPLPDGRPSLPGTCHGRRPVGSSDRCHRSAPDRVVASRTLCAMRPAGEV